MIWNLYEIIYKFITMPVLENYKINLNIIKKILEF